MLHFLILRYITKLQYGTGILKQHCTGKKEKSTEQRYRIESSEINSSKYCQLIFDKRAKNTYWGKDSFTIIVLGKLIIHMHKHKIEPFLILHHAQINSKWIEYLNLRPVTVKILEENIEEKF